MQIKSISKGNILLAQPTLYDFTFNRTVVIITDHNENGSIGFILNKPLHQNVGLFIAELESNLPVYEGGPVEIHNIYYIHKRPDLIANSEKIYNDLYWSGDYDDVRNAINNGLISENEIRFYLGYSGWGKNQLQSEVDENQWIIIDDRVNVFEDWDKNLWQQQIRNLGGEHLIWLNTPLDPSMN